MRKIASFFQVNLIDILLWLPVNSRFTTYGRGEGVYALSDGLYVPFHSTPLSGGPFLPESVDVTENHVRIDRSAKYGIRGLTIKPQKDLATVRVNGNSMIQDDVRDRDIILYQGWSFGYLTHFNIVIVEKLGEEGWGAWALKRLVIVRPPTIMTDECAVVSCWDDPVMILRSSNRKIKPWLIDPTGQYQVRGKFLRRLKAHEMTFVDSEEVRRRASLEGAKPAR